MKIPEEDFEVAIEPQMRIVFNNFYNQNKQRTIISSERCLFHHFNIA
tara:strand:+ start:396 stop:536 length:141 start_codon:yes stop_codon:yes gene_type:complete